MGDGTSNIIQMDWQTWSADLSGGQVHSADSLLLCHRRRTCTLEIGQVACSVHVCKQPGRPIPSVFVYCLD